MVTVKKIYFIYLKILWYANNGLSEVKRSGTFISSALTVGTFLKVFGYNITLMETAIFALLSIIASIVMGFYLTKKMEAIKYMNGIVNQENNELMGLIDSVKILESKIDKLLK